MPAAAVTSANHFGPGFRGTNSWLFRIEYAVGTLALVLALVGGPWGPARLGSLGAIGAAVFWFLWPDLLAFVPIGLVGVRGGEWPRWGPALYNTGHHLAVWAGVFVAWSWLTGGIAWPLIGWAIHITLDRAVGYTLRAAPSQPGAGTAG